jgi:hypothetical protein
MKILSLAAAISALTSGVSAKNYNILSLDSAAYSALMTAEFVSYMEKKAYIIAKREQCLAEERVDERIQMPELFDMLAGAETGAIIASVLSVPNDDASSSLKSKYYAQTAVDFFEKNVDTLYKDSEMSLALEWFFIALFLILFGAVAFKLAEYYFRNDSRSKRIDSLKQFIHIHKKILKGKEQYRSDFEYRQAEMN